MRNQHRALQKPFKFRKHLFKARLSGQHRRRYAGDLYDPFRKRAAGVDQLGKLPHFPAGFDAHRADFNDLVPIWVEPRGFKVQHDKGGLRQRARVCAGDDLRRVFNQIALAAGNEFYVLAAHRAERFRKRLNAAVIGHSDGRMPPRRRLRNQRLCRGAGVHRAHLRVQMQLHALARRVVLAHGLGHGHDV